MSKTMNRKRSRATRDYSTMFENFDIKNAHLLTPSESALFQIRFERAIFEDQILESVKAARKANVSWRKIGIAMGVSAQAVHRKYSPLV
jgi:hypothetical protein